MQKVLNVLSYITMTTMLEQHHLSRIIARLRDMQRYGRMPVILQSRDELEHKLLMAFMREFTKFAPNSISYTRGLTYVGDEITNDIRELCRITEDQILGLGHRPSQDELEVLNPESYCEPDLPPAQIAKYYELNEPMFAPDNEDPEVLFAHEDLLPVEAFIGNPLLVGYKVEWVALDKLKDFAKLHEINFTDPHLGENYEVKLDMDSTTYHYDVTVILTGEKLSFEPPKSSDIQLLIPHLFEKNQIIACCTRAEISQLKKGGKMIRRLKNGKPRTFTQIFRGSSCLTYLSPFIVVTPDKLTLKRRVFLTEAQLQELHKRRVKT